MYRTLLPSLLGTGDFELRFVVRRRVLAAVRAAVGRNDEVVAISSRLDVGPHGSAGRRVWPRQVLSHTRRYQADVVVLNTMAVPESFTVLRQARARLKLGLLHNPGAVPVGWRPGANEMLACLHRFNFESIRDSTPVQTYFEPYSCPQAGALSPRGPELRVAATGVISLDRRDYELLVHVAEELAREGRERLARFEVVGDASLRDGPELRRRVEAAGLSESFEFFEGLGDPEFFARLAGADYIAALVRPESGPYGHGKVTLAYGNSGALGRPLLIHADVAARIGLPADAAAHYTTARDVAEILQSGRAASDDRAAVYREWVAEAVEANKRYLESQGIAL